MLFRSRAVRRDGAFAGANQLGTSERTIKAHRSQVVEKMRADSVADLVRMADRLGVSAVVSGGSQLLK